MATAVKGLRSDATVIGVSMARGAAMQASLEAGHPVIVKELSTLADALCGGIGLSNQWTFDMCRHLVDEVLLLSESEIAAGIRHAYEYEDEVIEGAGSVGIGAVLAGKATDLRGPVVVVVSGQNIDTRLHQQVVHGEVNPLHTVVDEA